jgi:hypothetical protein
MIKLTASSKLAKLRLCIQTCWNLLVYCTDNRQPPPPHTHSKRWSKYQFGTGTLAALLKAILKSIKHDVHVHFLIIQALHITSPDLFFDAAMQQQNQTAASPLQLHSKNVYLIHIFTLAFLMETTHSCMFNKQLTLVCSICSQLQSCSTMIRSHFWARLES